MESKRAKLLDELKEAVLFVLIEAVAVHMCPVDRVETPADTRLDRATAHYIDVLQRVRARASTPQPTGSRSALPRSGNADKPPRPRKRRASSRRPT